MKRLLAVGLILALTGCASLPMAGPIRIGPDLVAAGDGDSFYYSPSAPVDGASQAEIVSGFLAAGTGPQNDYAVAREFLSTSIRSIWNPNQEVLIQRSSPKISVSGQDTATAQIDVSATVDADGKYQTSGAGTNRVLEFELVMENSQWRLSKVPDATVLIKPVFDVVFSGYALYFVDRQMRYLVPELRWFPTTAATGTRLANALLRGASDWLKPAVYSGIPSGTRLSIDAVTVEDGTALVDLTARALVASRTDRYLIKAQLQATLSQLPTVSEVAISIERSAQDITDTEADARKLEPRVLALLGEEGLEVIASQEPAFFQPGKDFFELTQVSEIAISKAAGSIAAATGSGVIRTGADQPGEQVELIDGRAGISAIDYDPQQYLWSLSRSSGSQIFATFTDGTRSIVRAPWLAGESVVDFALSPEGTRAAALVRSPQGTRVLVSAVVRNQAGMPVEMVRPLELSRELSSPVSITWLDQISVAIVSASVDSPSALVATVGGTSRVISLLPGTKQILAVGSNAQPHLLTNEGRLFSLRGSSWAPLRDGVDSVTIID
jgi:hypothetical protein